jgi:hypothetical protein
VFSIVSFPLGDQSGVVTPESNAVFLFAEVLNELQARNDRAKLMQLFGH